MTREIYEDLRKHAIDTEIGFLGRWSLLSGGTFSLLIPLIQSLKNEIVYQILFKLGEILLLISLISSLIGLFSIKEFIKKRTHYWPSTPDKSDTRYVIYWKIKEWTPTISLLAYIMGLIFIALFINCNLF